MSADERMRLWRQVSRRVRWRRCRDRLLARVRKTVGSFIGFAVYMSVGFVAMSLLMLIP